eukprot:318132-Hanusia_phi.AAC.3
MEEQISFPLGSSCLHLLRSDGSSRKISHPAGPSRSEHNKAKASVPGDFPNFQEAVLKAHRRRNISQLQSILVHASKLHDWSGVVSLRTPVSVHGINSPVLSG